MTSPPPPVPSRRTARPRGLAVVATGIAGVVAGIALFTVVLRVAGTRSVPEPTAAEAAFDVGSAEQRARAIARDRTPLLFQDPLGDGRDIYVQHLGSGSWTAFEARAPRAAARCILQWQVEAQHFVDPCDRAVYPPDGTGLVSYPARVQGGRLLVDLRSPTPPPPTSVLPPSSDPAASDPTTSGG